VVDDAMTIAMIPASDASMTTTRLLLTAWDFDPSVCVGCALALALYLWKVKAGAWRRSSFAAGIAVMFLALESPLDALSDSYLFSAHMAQHLLLILIVPPLLLLGIPRQTAQSWLKVPVVARAERLLGRPGLAWFAAIAVMTLWHLPVLYNFALAHEGVHIFQHLSFLVTATMFWWPVLHPVAESRLATGTAVLYLFAAAAENSVLGIILTFMRVGYYPAYLHPNDDLGALHLIRHGWGLSAAADQRLGGLLMWIPGCSVYFVAILAILAVWYSASDLDSDFEHGILEASSEGAR
jgi:cytochrome c oxidase assembly factor CtaG